MRGFELAAIEKMAIDTGRSTKTDAVIDFEIRRIAPTAERAWPCAQRVSVFIRSPWRHTGSEGAAAELLEVEGVHGAPSST